MTTEERRIKILEKRIRLLAEYLDKSEDGDESFAEFVKSKGITYKMFIKDLPPGYDVVPPAGRDEILEYAIRLQDLYDGQFRIMEMENDRPDINELEKGVINYQPAEFGCDGCTNSKCKNGSEYASADGTTFSAAGCGVPPIPPPFPNPKKTNNPVTQAARKSWDKYKERYASYRRCVNAQKEYRKRYSNADKASHLLHLSNPSEATGRAAFLRLLEFNIFGLASTFDKMRQDPNQSYWDSVNRKFYQLGGSEKKLDQNTSMGKNKKPVFKPKGWKPKGGSHSADGDDYSNQIWYNAEAWTAAGIAALIAAAAGMLGAMAPMIKSFKKDKGEQDVDFSGSPDPSYTGGDTPEGQDPGGAPTEGLSVGQWVGVSIGVSLVLGLVGYGIYKAVK